jgi:hypothetical protein
VRLRSSRPVPAGTYRVVVRWTRPDGGAGVLRTRVTLGRAGALRQAPRYTG